MKRQPLAFQPMTGKTLALIFEKPSTRTRVSFEVGMRQLGGQVTTLSGAELQLGRGETVGDTGRVLSRYVDLVMIRTFEEHKLHELAAGCGVPVINGLTNQSHPCQVMADIMTVEEWLGGIADKTVAWCGDGDDNVLISWIYAAVAFDFTLRIVCPPSFRRVRKRWSRSKGMAPEGERDGGHRGDVCADVVVTDCWVSMHNSDAAARDERLEPYQVDGALMRRAAPNAIFLHRLPAHRGEEVTDESSTGRNPACGTRPKTACMCKRRSCAGACVAKTGPPSDERRKRHAASAARSWGRELGRSARHDR